MGNKKLLLLYLQIIFTIFAFAAMVFLGYRFNSKTVHKHMLNTADNVLFYTQQQIEYELVSSRVLLGGYSDTIQNIVNDGNDNLLKHYFELISEYFISKKSDINNVIGFYGYMKNENGENVFMGGECQIAANGGTPEEQPWYKAAFENCGHIAETYPYKVDHLPGIYIITYSRCIHGRDNSHKGVVCIDVSLERVAEIVVNAAVNDGGYGAIASQDYTMFAHKNPAHVGRKMNEPNLQIAQFTPELDQGLDLYERSMKNWKREDVVVFTRRISNGWIILLLCTKTLFYRSTAHMLYVLCILGSLSAAVLIMILIKIDHEKNKSDVESRQKSAFLANMSHEIRTPLNVILGITEMQLQKESVAPDIKEGLNKIYESGDLLLSLINDILDFSKIESGKLELIPVKYDIPSLINDTAQLSLFLYKSKPITFSLNVAEDMPYHLIGDELRIKHVLNNLLSNSYKYTDEGKIDFSISVEPCGNGNDTENVMLVMQVNDTGQGMTESQLKCVFDEYMRFNLRENRTITGIGLGMSITKRFVDLMKGNISIKSEPGKGTEVVIRIPQKRAGTEICGAEIVNNLKSFSNKSNVIMKKMQFMREYMPYGSVLVVDDVESNTYVARGMLVPYGLQIDTVSSAYEAIDKVKTGNIYDIIFMDHMMPGMNGIDALKHIRGLGYKNPIIVCTANNLTGQEQMFLEYGFDSFISKPLDSRKLNILLNEFIRNRKPPDVVEAARREQSKRNLVVDDVMPSSNQTESLNAGSSGKLSDKVKIFLKDAQNTVNVLETLYAKLPDLSDEEIGLYTIMVHGIKSAFAIFGENELFALAFKLEKAGDEKNILVMLNETPALMGALKALIAKLKPEKESGDVELSDGSRAFLREKMTQIRNECIALNKIAAKNALAELKQTAWPEHIDSALDEISMHLLHSAFKKAASATEKYIT